jgi:hypothetical protein
MIPRAEIIKFWVVRDLNPLGRICINVIAKDHRCAEGAVTLMFQVNPRTFKIELLRIPHVNDALPLVTPISYAITDLVETLAREHAAYILQPPSRR